MLHVNDIHAHYDPSDVNFGTCDLEGGAPVCFGGIARLASAVAEAKAEGEAAGMDTIVLHAGDQFTGGEGMGVWLGCRSCQHLLAARCQVGCDGFGHPPHLVHACAGPVHTAPPAEAGWHPLIAAALLAGTLWDVVYTSQGNLVLATFLKELGVQAFVSRV